MEININVNDGVAYKTLDTVKEIAVIVAKQENFSVAKKAEVAQTQGIQNFVSFIGSLFTEFLKAEANKKNSAIMPLLLTLMSNSEAPEKSDESEPEQKAE